MTAPPPVRCAPDLLEAVIEREIDRCRRRGDAARVAAYREAADALYATHDDPESRQAAFQRLHARLFEALGYARPIHEALERLGLTFEAILIARAWKPAEEEADLSPDRSTLGLRLLPDRFGTPALARVANHELGHVCDMCDPAFAYGASDAPAPRATGQLQADRFGLLWDCVVDGRTARAGLAPLETREERLTAFGRLFPAFRHEAAAIIVDRLWEGVRPTYDELVRFAGHPAALAAWAGVPAAFAMAAGLVPPDDAPAPIRGAPCPLCGFPTFTWARAMPEALAMRIAADFPGWSRALGACERCAEGYAVMAEYGGGL